MTYPACYWLSGRNPKFNRHLANMLPGPILMATFGGRVGLCPSRVGPILMSIFGDRVGFCPPRAASPAVLGVWPTELYLLGPSFGRLVIEWIFSRRERRLRQFWACVRLSYFPRGPSFWPSLVIECIFARREWGPSLWPTLVIEWGLCPPSEASPAVLGVWPIELYLSGPFILAKFGDRMGL